jgi:hypothetical protein
VPANEALERADHHIDEIEEDLDRLGEKIDREQRDFEKSQEPHPATTAAAEDVKPAGDASAGA